MRTNPRISLIGFCGSAGALLLAACGSGSPGGANPAVAAGLPVVVYEATAKTVPIYNEQVARIDADSTVDIRARIEGTLEKRHFQEGTLVREGQLLFAIDRKPYEIALQAARARLSKAEADLTLASEQASVRTAKATLAQAEARYGEAQQDVARLRPLAEQYAVPKQDLDQAVARETVARSEVEARNADLENAILRERVGVEQARSAVEGAKAEVARAELDLGFADIHAPISGLIGRSQVSAGNLVGRGEPTILTSVSRLDPVSVTFAISELDYLRFTGALKGSSTAKPEELGKLDLVLADNSLYPHSGTFSVADRAVDPTTGTLTVVAKFPNPDGRLRPGLFGRVRYVTEIVENAVVIPQRCILELQSAQTAFVVGPDNKISLRTLELGPRFENMAVVKSGLEAGERVVVEGHQKVRPGMTVSPTSSPASEETVGR